MQAVASTIYYSIREDLTKFEPVKGKGDGGTKKSNNQHRVVKHTEL